MESESLDHAQWILELLASSDNAQLPSRTTSQESCHISSPAFITPDQFNSSIDSMNSDAELDLCMSRFGFKFPYDDGVRVQLDESIPETAGVPDRDLLIRLEALIAATSDSAVSALQELPPGPNTYMPFSVTHASHSDRSQDQPLVRVSTDTYTGSSTIRFEANDGNVIGPDEELNQKCVDGIPETDMSALESRFSSGREMEGARPLLRGSPADRQGSNVVISGPVTLSQCHSPTDGCPEASKRIASATAERIRYPHTSWVTHPHTPQEALFPNRTYSFPILGCHVGEKLSDFIEWTNKSDAKPDVLVSPTSDCSAVESISIDDELKPAQALIIGLGALALTVLFESVYRRRNGENDASSGGVTASSAHNKGSESTSKRKRKRELDRSPSDDEDDRESRKRNRLKRGLTSNKEKRPELMACPFHKYDSFLFGPDSPEPAYHVCGTSKFILVAHLKQHLQRVHSAPKFYCYSCCRSDFENQISLMAHMRVRPACEPCEPPLYVEKISQELAIMLRLSRKNDLGADKIAYWFEVFDTLFPGIRDTRNIDPYYLGPGYQLLCSFSSFSQLQLPRIVARVEETSRTTSDEDRATGRTRVHLMNEILQEALRRFEDSLIHLDWPRLAQTQTITQETAVQGDINTANFSSQSQENSMDRPLSTLSPELQSPDTVYLWSCPIDPLDVHHTSRPGPSAERLATPQDDQLGHDRLGITFVGQDEELLDDIGIEFSYDLPKNPQDADICDAVQTATQRFNNDPDMFINWTRQ